MNFMGLCELRETYLKFFESKNHYRLESASLVPTDDNSLLLINSGMAPLKKYFLNQQTPKSKRITTCQKCIRTLDIENVGKTSRHGTFFEMLGNFSFGDYFKKDSIKWAYEFLIDELKIPLERLWVSIYLDDNETFDIWTNDIGFPEKRIVRLGKEDNFWEIGSGPCGPCSEIYFDRGEDYACSNPNCSVGCDCDRYVEFWNIVFSQFDSDGNGNYSEMEQKNIDTGMGLERLACIMQGVDNIFEVDTIKNIINELCLICNVKYKESEKIDVSLRVIADHIRSTVFMVCDGIQPSNEGRGYVLRRLLRRAARHGRLLNIKKPFLYKLCEIVINENYSSYPELLQKKDYIVKIINIEEEKFEKTIDLGINLLNEMLEKMKINKIHVMSGKDAFKLYDTFGFPIDLTKEILEENNFTLDEDAFLSLMEEQKNKSRNARVDSTVTGWKNGEKIDINIGATEFIGYDNFKTIATITKIFVDNNEVDVINEGQKGKVLLDKTVFYAEGGGQSADYGYIFSENSVLYVYDCKKDEDSRYFHFVECKKGQIKSNDIVKSFIDKERRLSIMAHHTGAHLLHSALRSVLGTHVNQAGQSVDDKKIRFDFTHHSPLSFEELLNVENLINDCILNSFDVVAEEMDINSAKKKGAIALFGEKYGDFVRVLSIGKEDFKGVNNVSVEFCGGTHVNNTSKLGLFKILSESSVSSGIRRIEAVCRRQFYNKVLEDNKNIQEIANILKSNVNDIKPKLESVLKSIKDSKSKIKSLYEDIASAHIDSVYKNCETLENKCTFVYFYFKDYINIDVCEIISDKLREKDKSIICVFVIENKSNPKLLLSCGKDAVTKGYNANKLIKQIAGLVSGKGGGRPDSAVASISDAKKLDSMKLAIVNLVSHFLD